jgi:hypothetical protein
MLKTVVFAPMQTASVRVAKRTSTGSRLKLRTARGTLWKSLAVTLVPSLRDGSPTDYNTTLRMVKGMEVQNRD